MGITPSPPPRASIKRPHHKDTITEEQIVEYKKCHGDPQYFIENYVYIQTDLGAQLFKLRKYQKKIVKGFMKNDFNILLQPRQSGKSSVVVAFYLWLAVFHKDKIIGLAAHKGKNAKDLIKRTKYAYEFLPLWMKPAVLEYNVHNIVFDNHSEIISTTTTEDSFRGMSLTGGLYLDEFAFVKPKIAEEFWTSILPSLSGGHIDGKKVIITSTPNGSEGLFAELWFGAERDENGFNAIQVKNSEVPGRGEKFKKKMLLKMTREKYEQEFNCAFISSGGTLIRSTILECIKPKKPIKKVDNIDIFEDIKNKNLVVGIDVAEGIGDAGDYSVIQVFDKNTLNQVAEFRDNDMNLTDFAKKIIHTLHYLKKEGAKEIFYTIESNPIGQSIIHLFRNSDHEILDECEFISQRKSKHKGFYMTNPLKMKGCAKFKDLVEMRKMTIHSKSLLSELRFFVKSGQSFKAESGKHDDLVMGCVLVTLCLQEIARFDDEIHDRFEELPSFQLEDLDESGDVSGVSPIIF